METSRLLTSRTTPTAILLALIAFGGCVDPSYRADTGAYFNNPRLVTPTLPPGTPQDAVYVAPLGIRRSRADGDLRVDVLLSGPNAFDIAQQWTEAPARNAAANAAVSLRRINPDPAPLNLRFTGPRIEAVPINADGRELYRGIGRGDERIMLTLTLSASPSFSPGRYELTLLVPQGEQATAWSIGSSTIAVDRRAMNVIISNTGNIEPEMIMGMP